MLFCKDIEGLHDDGFEGSNDEHNIFREVFFGDAFANSSISKRCVVTGVINFEPEGRKHINASHCSNSENSGITSQSSSKNIYVDDGVKQNTRRSLKLGSFLGSSSLVGKDGQDVRIKRMRMSIDDCSNMEPDAGTTFSPSTSSKGVFSGVPSPDSHTNQNIVYPLVESTREGVTTSCYLLRRHAEFYRGDMDERNVSNSKMLGLEGNKRMDITQSKALVLPVPQKGFATNLLLASPSNEANFNELALSSTCLGKYLKKDSITDPRPLLHYHAIRILGKAGWIISKHKRSGKSKVDSTYRSPEGVVVREFVRAWGLSCDILFTDDNEYELVQEKEGMQWTDIGQFWSDLSNTLFDVEQDLNHPNTTAQLAYWWCRLDPFVAVVFVDKRIKALRKGYAVKATKSVFINKNGERDVELPLLNVISFENQFVKEHASHQFCDSSERAIIVSNKNCFGLADDSGKKEFSQIEKQTQKGAIRCSDCMLLEVSEEKRGHIIFEAENQSWGLSGNSVSCSYMSTVPPQSDSTSIQSYGCLFDVPLFCENVNMVPGVVETVSPNQDSNASFLSCELNLDKYMDVVVYRSSDSMEEEVKDRNDDDNLVSSDCQIKDGDLLISSKCQIKDEDLLISAIIKHRDVSTCVKQYSSKAKIGRPKGRRKLKNQKGSCKLLPRSSGKGGKHYGDGIWLSSGLRTVLSWLIDSGVVSLSDIIQYRDPKDDAVVKDGLLTENGILCKCCNNVLSLSKFKSHAGYKLNRPCLNLFMGSGQPFTLCQLQAWSAEYKARKAGHRFLHAGDADQNDDACGLCGDGGELICCDGCPSTFHQSCLFAQDLPEGSWYCLNCTCFICGDVANNKEASSPTVALKCSQCEHKYHKACLKETDICHGVASDAWFCGRRCQEVYLGLRSRVGVMNHISDGIMWTLLRCIHGDQKVHSAQRFALKAECNSKLAVALSIMEECFLSMVDQRTGIDILPQLLYNWESNFARLNFQSFYTIVLERDDVLLSVASIRVHGAIVAEMPLIATCSKYRRQGMCRLLMRAIEEMLKVLKVQMLVIAAIPTLVETWTSGFGFEPLEEHDKATLSNINLMVFTGTVLLKKVLYVNNETNKLSGCGGDASIPEESNKMGDYSKGHTISKLGHQPDANSCDIHLSAELQATLAGCENLRVR